MISAFASAYRNARQRSWRSRYDSGAPEWLSIEVIVDPSVYRPLVRKSAAGFVYILSFAVLWCGPVAASGDAKIDYYGQIQPIFDRYCVACHACFDAPCQLNLASGAGVERGANKKPVYDGARLEPVPPTRLFIDAHTEAGWRERGFYSVTRPQPESASLLLRLLELKRAHPLRTGQPIPEGVEVGIRRKNHCVKPEEVDDFMEDYQGLGMPFALPGLRDEEHALLVRWLKKGAPVNEQPLTVSASERRQIDRWERWLNRGGAREALVARWLFEHWAIARLYFDAGRSGNFFRLVRSRTPPGEAVVEITTRRPNQDPQGQFYYRFRAERGTRVYKTHIVFGLDKLMLDRLQQNFLGDDWQVTRQAGYTDAERANPFATFGDIPARSRYEFMLEHAGYFVQTFIRGPVCRGQLATDVIRDHFWVMFQDPEDDPYINSKDYREAVTPLLGLPGGDEDLLDGAVSWIDSETERDEYLRRRQKQLAAKEPFGPGLEAIWNGEGRNKNALLTVFRHHDSATVKRGWFGQYPLTAWWMDYPLLERSYYNLVVNFDVFGSLAHQAQTRLYFDLIRHGAEQNFLRLLPAKARQERLDQWYRGLGKLKLWLSYQSIDTNQPAAVVLQSNRPYEDLLGILLQRFASINAASDPINRPAEKSSGSMENLLSRLPGVTAVAMPAIQHLPDASILRVTHDDGKRSVYTLIRNRRHSNVAFVLGESLRYEPEKDTLSVLPGVATTYPNFLFNIRVSDLSTFIETLRAKDLDGIDEFRRRVIERWGMRRSAPEFWDRFHDVNDYLKASDPITAGMLDVQRYVDF